MMRLLAVAATVVVAVVLFVVLRPADESGNGTTTGQTGPPPATTTEPSPTGTETRPATTATEPSPPPPPPVVLTTIGVTVRGGTPVGGIKRTDVARGRRVQIIVRSDVSDHIHLHGYDIMRDVGPGQPARIRFTADVPGRFEVELEDRGVQLIDLRVRP